MTTTVEFVLGGESVTVPLDIQLASGDNPISGDVSGLIGDAHIVGDLNLTGDLFVEGHLTGIDTFTIHGNGHSVFFQNGGWADLHGKVKAAWGEWGTDSTGWAAGDRIAVAPTAFGVYVPTELVWSDWSMSRPTNSPDVTLVDGPVRKPEVVNLSQSIVFRNLSRGFHFHDSAGVQKLSDVKFLNCGTTGVLGHYPVHFHLLGENSRGSVLERVVVEGGKNHAFVPHGSHGITFQDVVAYKTTNHAYWWDYPFGNTANNSNDIHYHHALALDVQPNPSTPHGVAGFDLGSGTGNECTDSVAAAIRGGNNIAGFSWPEQANNPPNVWLFEDCVGHNSKESGLRVWQNNADTHEIARYLGYRNRAGINHGAYRNRYHYAGATLSENTVAVRSHALTATSGTLLYEDLITDGSLEIAKHRTSTMIPVVFRRCRFTAVLVKEALDGGTNPGTHVFEDCGLVPADFDLSAIVPGSVLEIYEGGVLEHRWASGIWS